MEENGDWWTEERIMVWIESIDVARRRHGQVAFL